MENVSASVEAFFRRFEVNGSKSDVSETISQFADTFMAAGPQGAQCVRAGDGRLRCPNASSSWLATVANRCNWSAWTRVG